MKYTMDSRIADIVQNHRGKALAERYTPDWERYPNSRDITVSYYPRVCPAEKGVTLERMQEFLDVLNAPAETSTPELMTGVSLAVAAVPEGLLMPVPKGLSLAQAAALPEVYGAAYLFLCMEGNIKAGDTLLMQAGASGLASVIIPMAKAFGARVITTVMNDELEQKIRHLPADLVVNTARQSLKDVMKAELDAGRGVDITIDCLGGETVGECLPYMNFDGRWIMIATLADDFTTVNMRSMYARRTRLIGTNLRSRTPAQKKQLLSEMTEILWPKVESGEVRPTIHKIFPIAQAEQAHEEMRSGRSAGKMVLIVREEGETL